MRLAAMQKHKDVSKFMVIYLNKTLNFKFKPIITFNL